MINLSFQRKLESRGGLVGLDSLVKPSGLRRELSRTLNLLAEAGE